MNKKCIFILGMSLTVLLSGCINNQKDEYLTDTPKSKILHKEYSKDDFKNLIGDTEYAENYSSINEAILEEVLNKIATKKTKEGLDEAISEYKKEYKKEYKTDMSKEELESYTRNIIANKELQNQYSKYLEKTPKEDKKEWESNPKSYYFIQVILNPNLSDEERAKYKPMLAKELDKITDINKATDFIMMYGESNTKTPSNKQLEDRLIVDMVQLNKYNAEGIFDTAMYLKPFNYEKIGKENYEGFIMKIKENKMTKDEFKESRYIQKLNKSKLINTENMLLKIDKEEEDVYFNKYVTKAIKNNWEESQPTK